MHVIQHKIQRNTLPTNPRFALVAAWRTTGIGLFRIHSAATLTHSFWCCVLRASGDVFPVDGMPYCSFTFATYVLSCRSAAYKQVSQRADRQSSPTKRARQDR